MSETNDTKMPSARWLMDEHKDASYMARLYLMFAKAQELEREIEELRGQIEHMENLIDRGET